MHFHLRFITTFSLNNIPHLPSKQCQATNLLKHLKQLRFCIRNLATERCHSQTTRKLSGNQNWFLKSTNWMVSVQSLIVLQQNKNTKKVKLFISIFLSYDHYSMYFTDTNIFFFFMIWKVDAVEPECYLDGEPPIKKFKSSTTVNEKKRYFI